MTSIELRQKFLKFFQDKNHRIIPQASLVPAENIELTGTQRVLFTTAGMHPLVPYLLGDTHPQGSRLVNIQRCLRTDDIEEVGDEVHNTFFEMLGNWSLGDYWKQESISWSYEFLINELKLDANRIYVSVFAGDSDAPFDEEAFQTWTNIGVAENHIFRYGKKDNWWGPAGQTGPCGPDTEIFYDRIGGNLNNQDPSNDPERFVEIWNNVFMQYDKNQKGEFKPLAQKNVDTGMGLERILMILQNASSIYETDVFLPLVKQIEEYSQNYNIKSARIVADHIRSSIFLIADNVIPTNLERGYVLRRLIRRIIRHASLLKIKDDFLEVLAKTTIKVYKSYYPFLEEFQSTIFDTLKEEENKFKFALAKGIREFEKIKGDISGQKAFDLYQNFGFPIELTVELAVENNKKVDITDFEIKFKKHQELSRIAGEKTQGGLAVQSQSSAKLHTATHLLHQALRDVLGLHVHQTGSHITNQRLRFDFKHNQKLSEEQIKKVEQIVNDKIKQKLTVFQKNMPKQAADQVGAIGLFSEKYQEMVKIYYIGSNDDVNSAYSKEFCGGPHTINTNDLISFKINKEESAGANVRRIYATIGS